MLRLHALAVLAAGLTAAGAIAVPASAEVSASPTAAGTVQRACTRPVQPNEVACFAVYRTDVEPHLGVTPGVAPPGYGPTDLQSAYQLPAAAGGAGQTVAIVDAMDNPNVETDLAVYRAQFGLPACTTANGCFRKVDQRGGTALPAPDPGWAQEIALDVDMVSAACPNCHILLVEADSSNLADMGTAVDTAVGLGARFVSNSYGTGYSSTPGSGEAPEELQWDAYYDHPGVAVVASSGDSGYGVSYPAASSHVTSVGGTSLTRDSSARGWGEKVWSGTGSGCSTLEPRLPVQSDQFCANRAVADVSAVADPQTGVAVYTTYPDGGWRIFGGTSASAPLIASVYALAGTPAEDTDPNAYPYWHRSALNDVTSGANGTCDPALLCTGGAGYDGPTGLGTPAGTAAFTLGPHGTVSGTVTDAATGAPLAGVLVSAGTSISDLTDASGRYSLTLPVDDYDLTVFDYGYAEQRLTATVTDGSAVTRDLALATSPTVTFSGTVTDASGHGWPLYAKITVDHVPGPPIHTDPLTGHYAVELAGQATYTLHVTPMTPGYQPATRTVEIGAADTRADVAVPIDATQCDVAGYHSQFADPAQTFDATTAPPDWTIGNAHGSGTDGWRFDDPGGLGNRTGGSGGFAVLDNANAAGTINESDLNSPIHDLSDASLPVLSFDTSVDTSVFTDDNESVEVFTNDDPTAGRVVWAATQQNRDRWHVDIPLPFAAHSPTVRVRFFYAGIGADTRWEIDNVVLGDRTCEPTPGGLVAGHTHAANDASPLGRVQVSAGDAAGATAVSMPTDGTAVDGGFYELFSPHTGPTDLTASLVRYQDAHATVAVQPDAVTRADLSLDAAHLTVSTGSVSGSTELGGTVTRQLTVHNDGAVPAHVSVAADQRDVTPPPDTSPQWTDVGSYPIRVRGNVMATDPASGRVYSVTGIVQAASTDRGYVFDPVNGAWTPIADAPEAVRFAAAGFVGGRLVVAGGQHSVNDAAPLAAVHSFDPGTGRWSDEPDLPAPTAAAGSAVLDDQLYVVGGCQRGGSCEFGATRAVWRYDPTTASWTALADYPEREAHLACGGVAGRVICAGGSFDSGAIALSKAAYSYDPVADVWTRVADLPTAVYLAQAVVGNGQLVVAGGVVATADPRAPASTDQVVAYQPGRDTWTALPDTPYVIFGGSGACGGYVMGEVVAGSASATRLERLSGYESCTTTPSWLSVSPGRLDVAAHGDATVTVTLDAAAVAQPGTYTADLVLRSDAPGDVAPVRVSLSVTPPRSWGRVAGTVTGTTCDGETIPVAAADIEITSKGGSISTSTDRAGRYGVWLDHRSGTLTVIVSRDGWESQTRTVKVKAGTTTTASFTLVPAKPCQ